MPWLMALILSLGVVYSAMYAGIGLGGVVDRW